MINLLRYTVLGATKIVKFILTYTAGTGGSISGQTPQLVNKGGNGTPVEAIPDEGYAFKQWSDAVATASRTDTDVQANLTVEAIFESTAPPVPLTVVNTADWSLT